MIKSGNIIYLGKAQPEGGSSGGSATIESLTVTPTTSQQTIIASGVDGYAPITVNAVTNSIDENITSVNIVNGVTILGVTGSATELNGTTLNVTPTTSAQTIIPTSPNNGFTEVDVSAVTSSIDANITAGNIKKDVQILGVTGTFEGSSGELQLTRFKDDNDNEIGTHYFNFTDGNGQTYKVIVLDAQYRTLSASFCVNNGTITNLPLYMLSKGSWWYNDAKESATFNTQKIIDWLDANEYISLAINACKDKSFTINGVTYRGLLPNMREAWEIWRRRAEIEALDPTSSTNTSINLNSARSFWSSTQYSSSLMWNFMNSGEVTTTERVNSRLVIPVLEIPVS